MKYGIRLFVLFLDILPEPILRKITDCRHIVTTYPESPIPLALKFRVFVKNHKCTLSLKISNETFSTLGFSERSRITDKFKQRRIDNG